MDSPFPGMDPYLEQHWRSVHQRLITYAGDQLQAELPRRFRVDVEERVFTETYLEIVDTVSGNRVITAIEFLSPTNKLPGDGHDLYVRKQREYRAAGVSQVEIDLTRHGDRSTVFPMAHLARRYRTLYLAWGRRSWQPAKIEVYPLPLREPLPTIGIPLIESHADAPLDLQAIVTLCYRNGRYDDIDYRRGLQPPLPPEEAAWAEHLLQSRVGESDTL